MTAGDAEFILQSYGRQMSKMCTQSIDLNFEDVQNVQILSAKEVQNVHTID